jgi:hypothetical protein
VPPRISQEHGKSAKPSPKIAPRTSSKVLEKIRQNRKGDWQIADIEKVCNDIGLTIKPPAHGSHFKVSSKHLTGILTIPAHRPIKIPYINLFISLADAHMKAVTKEESCD